MDSEPRITLEIPDPEGFDDEYSHAIPISSQAVTYTIDLLQCFIAQYRLNDGCEPDHAVWDRLATAAGHALSGLLSAHSAYYHDRDARPLIEQIAFFCRSDGAPGRLAPLREPGAVDIPANGPQAADIVDALLALHEESERHHKERMQQEDERRRTQRQQQRAAPEQAPGGERDGWDF